MASHITSVTSSSHLDTLLSDSSKISICDFWAQWCGPCHAIAPHFQRLSTQFRQVQFLKVDVDQQQQIAQRFGISAMPTFVVCRGSQKIDEMRGANPAGLEALIRKHAGAPNPNAGSSAGPSASGSGSNGAAKAPAGLEGYSSLGSNFDIKQFTCLNEDPSHTFQDLVKRNGNGGGYLQSDADEQLLLNIAFQSASRVRAVTFKAPPADQLEKAPKTVKFFVNKETLGFDDAESLEAAHSETLTEAQATGKDPVLLRFVRFQNVNSLQVFVADNQGGGDETRLYGIEVIGSGQPEGTGEVKPTQKVGQGMAQLLGSP